VTGDTPVPRGRGTLWRDLQHEWLPYLVFGAVLLGTIALWRGHVGHAVLVGRTEAVRIPVSPAHGGVVVRLNVDLLQRVHRGDVLAEIVPADVEAVRAGLLANLESLRAQMLQGLDRNTVNFQQFRLDWMRRQLELASARVDLQFADNEYRRAVTLHDQQILSDADFEAKRTVRDALQVKVDTLTRIAAALEREINQPSATSAPPEQTPAERAIAAGAVLLQKQLEAQAAATVLRAPADGVVTTIGRTLGENVAAGEPVVTLGAIHPTRIVAYERQPLRHPLHSGDRVRVRSRATHASADARVLQVGAQLDTIDPALLPLTVNGHVAEAGLPLLVELPAQLALAPGEIVDLSPIR
jgi:multidrug resistance efflux pump